MCKFSTFMVVGSMLLLVFAPLWGHLTYLISKNYELSSLVSVYILMVPWVIFFGTALIWLYKKFPKEF